MSYIASFLIKFIDTLASNANDIEITELFKELRVTERSEAIFELSRKVADTNQPNSLCMPFCRLPRSQLPDVSLKQDLTILKITIFGDDKHMSEELKFMHIWSILKLGAGVCGTISILR